MSMRSSALAVALIGLAALPAAASAAPAATFGAYGDTYKWSSDPGAGAVYTSDVSSRVPACSPIFNCNQVLIETTAPGDLQVAVKGVGLQGQDTLKDVDLHVYESDADGTKGEVLNESTGSTADETVLVEDAAPGFYLLYTDWYLGVGSIDGTATLLEPVDEGF
jgi:hypothetical protein